MKDYSKLNMIEWENRGLVQDANDLLGEPFNSERELTDFIDHYAPLFAKDVLNINYKSHTREYYLGQRINTSRGIGNKPHIDFLFQSLEGENILIECKNPTNTYAEFTNAIGQILSYYLTAKENGVPIDRMCIVTGKYNDKLRRVVNEFKLPIEIYLISKQNALMIIN